jgi:uncharacterized membrane protein YraQ (UPF0718 family)
MVQKIFEICLQILNDASPWLVLSFVLAGLLHNLLRPEKLQRHLGNQKLTALVKATLSGMLLPICSCGVIPLGLGLYHTGAYLGPTLAFMVATPIINPAAVLLAYGLLGPSIATIYLIAGFTVPILVGLLGNLFGGNELQSPGVIPGQEALDLPMEETAGFSRKLISGLEWGFLDLGILVSKYILVGVLLAGLIIALIPATYILGIALIGAVMYVCAVGHIPFIAALVAGGAAPGVAITFLMTGAATNLPELISIYKMIGKRTVAVYTVSVVTLSVLIGLFTNRFLLPEFAIPVPTGEVSPMVSLANRFIVSVPAALQYACSGLIVVLGAYGFLPRVRHYVFKAAA